MKRCNIVFFATLWALAIGMLSACTETVDGELSDGTVSVSLNTIMPDDITQRSASGTSSAQGALVNVDFSSYDVRYILKVYDENGVEEALSLEPVICDDAATPLFPDLTLTVDRTYKFVMWADIVPQGTSADFHYNTADFPIVSIQGNHTLNDETRDAYCAVSTLNIYRNTRSVELHLERPLAKLRVVTNDIATTRNTVAAVSIAYKGTFATAIDLMRPAAERAVASVTDPQFTAVLSDDFLYTAETSASPVTHRTLLVDYQFMPVAQSIASLTYTSYSDASASTSIGTPVTLAAPEYIVTLTPNALTTIQGSLLTTQVVDIWNGTDITAPRIANGVAYIESTANLAWLADEANLPTLTSAGVETISIENSLDMNGVALSSLAVPEGTTVKGNDNVISNLNMSGNVCGLFGDVKDFALSDLTIENADIANESCKEGVGILIGRSTGNLTLSGVTINSGSALAPCKVGTLVGAVYGTAGAKSVVSVTGCSIDGATAETSFLSGVSGECGGLIGYIGRDSYADRTSSLDVSISGCNLTATTVKSYMQAVEKPFARLVGALSGYDYQEYLTITDCDVTGVTLSPKTDNGDTRAASYVSPYGDMLGGEAYCRGTVTVDGAAIVPAWDGSRKITPIEAKTATASLDQGVTSGKLIYSPFDLASLQKAGHSEVHFLRDIDMASKQFNPINSITTLDGHNHTLHNLSIEVTNWIGGFINQADGTTTHKNLTFQNSFVRVSPSANSETAYAGTLCAYINSGNYTADSIKIDTTFVEGISKTGGLIGFVTAGVSKATIKNSSVNKGRIENQYLHIGGQDFAASGEMGGLIGYITANALVENCKVNNTVMNSVKSTARHVNQFIGDIVLSSSSLRVDINLCSVSGNSYEKSKNEQHKFVGGAYTTNTTWYIIVKEAGKLYIDGSSINVKAVGLCP